MLIPLLESLLDIETTPSDILDIQMNIQLPDTSRQFCQQSREKLHRDEFPLIHHHVGSVQPASHQFQIVFGPHRADQLAFVERQDVT